MRRRDETERHAQQDQHRRGRSKAGQRPRVWMRHGENTTCAQYTLVVPADIPLVTAREIDAVLAASPHRGTVLVPSASGRGTNAAPVANSNGSQRRSTVRKSHAEGRSTEPLRPSHVENTGAEV